MIKTKLCSLIHQLSVLYALLIIGLGLLSRAANLFLFLIINPFYCVSQEEICRVLLLCLSTSTVRQEAGHTL